MGTKLFSDLITFTRASSATRVNSSGLVETVASDQPRFDYDPVTLQQKGLLIEERRTNLLTYSEDLSNVNWAKAGTPILDPTIVDPFGRVGTVYYPTVSEITQGFNGNSAATLAVSFFAKKRVGSSNNSVVLEIFQQTSGTVVTLGSYAFSLDSANPDSTYFKSISRVALPNGWFRFTFQVIANTGAGLGNFSSSSRFDIEGGPAQNYIWGVQVEIGSFPTSYIPTTTAAATRAADVATITGTNFSSWYNQTEGTLFTEASVGYAIPSSGFPVVASLNDGTSNNRIENGFLTTTLGGFEAVAGGAFQAGMYPGSSASLRKLAGTYKINDFAVCVNGGSVSTDTSGTIPVVDRLRLGERNSTTNSSNFLNGHIRRITYYPRRLTDAELQALTS